MTTGALSAASTGLNFQDMKVRTIANNIANMSTGGFKRAIPVAVDLGYQNYQTVGSPTSSEGTINPTGIYVGLGVNTAGVVRDMKQGDIEMTDNQLDIMIQGEGYFQVELPSGDMGYTRNGSFILSAERQLITLDGYAFKPDLTIPEHTISVSINKSGEVYAEVQGETAPQLVGQIELAVFASPASLIPLGDNLFKESTASGSPTTGVAGSAGFGETIQFALETSNVKPVTELTGLIEAQRAYSMNTKTMNAVEQMDSNLQSLMR